MHYYYVQFLVKLLTDTCTLYKRTHLWNGQFTRLKRILQNRSDLLSIIEKNSRGGGEYKNMIRKSRIELGKLTTKSGKIAFK